MPAQQNLKIKWQKLNGTAHKAEEEQKRHVRTLFAESAKSM